MLFYLIYLLSQLPFMKKGLVFIKEKYFLQKAKVEGQILVNDFFLTLEQYFIWIFELSWWPEEKILLISFIKWRLI